ncbi:GntR family transcriptional regulator [Devosia geojensis]|nr:GntR family transcriptional regulator [Devosia geojensis]
MSISQTGAEVVSMLDTAEATSLSELAYTRLLDLILSGRIPPGTMLQERRLADMLSMSRTPLREALSRLEAEQMITRSHGRAPVVSNVGIENFIFTLDMRRILEVEAAGRATGRLTPELVAQVTASIETLMDIPAPTPAQHWAVDDLVHGAIADAAGNPLVAATIRDLRRRTRLFNTARIPKRLMPGASEHLTMINAVAGNDPEMSRQVMGRHIDNVRDAIIEFLLGSKRT